jgi:hypothetical protein
MANSQSVLTLQNFLDKTMPLGDVRPVLAEISGNQLEPFITICTDVYSDIVGTPFPHPWNEVKLPIFYTNSFQQDYVLLNPNGTSFFNLEWLERGIVIDMTSNTIPKAWGNVECGRQLTQATGTLVQPNSWQNPTFLAAKIYNYMQYYGTWGAGNSGNASQGNNPGPGSVFTNPLAANAQANNPITQVLDPTETFKS